MPHSRKRGRDEGVVPGSWEDVRGGVAAPPTYYYPNYSYYEEIDVYGRAEASRMQRELAGTRGLLTVSVDGRSKVRPTSYKVLQREAQVQTAKTRTACGEKWVPTCEDVSCFDHSPYLAMLRLAVGSGCYDHEASDDLPSACDCPAMTEDVDIDDAAALDAWLSRLPPVAREVYESIGDPITAKEQAKILREYKASMDPKQELLSCGCCGQRNYTRKPKEAYPSLPLTSLKCLRVSDEVVYERQQLGHYSQVYSMYRAQGCDDEKWYYVHPEFIEFQEERDEDSGQIRRMNETVRVCKVCYADLVKQKVPARTVKGRGDLGLAKRVPWLPEPSVLEEVVLAKVRPFMTTWKLGTANISDDRKQEGLVGHAISFAEDAKYKLPSKAEIMSETPGQVLRDVEKRVTVAFTGSKPQFMRHRKQLQDWGEFAIRPRVILEWLRFLKAVNPLYKDTDLKAWEAACGEGGVVSGLVTRILDVAADSLSDDDAEASAMARADAEAVSDIAAVRLAADGVIDGREAAEVDPVVTPVMVTDAHRKAATDGAVVGAIRNLVHGHVNLEAEEVPINEYLDLEFLIFGAFPVQFPLGQGVSGKGALNADVTSHLMSQFHLAFSHKPTLIFLLVNQLMRREAVRDVHARVKANPGSVLAFGRLAGDAAFIADLAVAHKDEKARKRVMKKVNPILKLCSKTIPLGLGESAEFISRMHATQIYVGIANCFKTFAPVDTRCALTQRAARPSTSNQCFPAQDVGFADAMARGDGECMGIPLAHHNLQRDLAKNPVAAEGVFNMLLESVMADLMGCPTDKSTKKTKAPKPGALGLIHGYCGCMECQARGSLHVHLAIRYGKLTPKLLENIAAYPTFMKRATRVMDSMFRASVSLEGHVKDLLRVQQDLPPPRYSCSPCPDPVEDACGFKDRIEGNMLGSGLHRHTFTCHHGVAGSKRCRMCHPRRSTPVSGIVQLDELVDGHGNRTTVQMGEIEEKDHLLHRDRDLRQYPVNPPDNRILAYELARPEVFTGDSFEDLLDDDSLPVELKVELEQLPWNAKQWLVECLKGRNGNVVEVIPLVSAALGCNTCSYPLGSMEQAKAAMYYIVEYMVKDPIQVAAAVVLIQKARIKAIRFRSVAEDRDTEIRQSMNFLMKTVNLFTGAKEVPATMAAMVLNGRSRFVSNHHHENLNVTGAVKYVRAEVFGEKDAYQREERVVQEESRECVSDDEEEDIDDDDQEDSAERAAAVETMVDLLPKTEPCDTQGTVDVYKVKGGKQKAVLYPEIYNYRTGGDMKLMSLYEFRACTELLAGAKGDKVWDEEVEQASGKAGRPPSYWEPLHKNCSLSKSHRLGLRSKQVVPVLGIGPPPKLPKGERPDVPGKHQANWDRMADKYAAYMLVLLKPWGFDNPLTDLSWDAFLDYCIQLTFSRVPIDRFRLSILNNITGENMVSSVKKRVLASRRAEEATVWNHDYGKEEGFMRRHDRTNEGRVPAKATNILGGATGQPMVEPGDVAALLESEDLDDLLEGAGKDAVYEKNLTDYIEATSASLRRIFDVPGAETAAEVEERQAPAVVPASRDHHEVIEKVRVFKPKKTPLPPAAKQGADDVWDREPGDHPSRQGPVQHGQYDELKFRGGVPPYFSRLPASLGIDHLNADQRPIFDDYLTFLRRLNRKETGLRTMPVPVPRILMHGPAGTGKTFTVIKIMEAATKYGYRCLPVAFQGSAASNMPGGITIHHLTKITVNDKGEGSHGIIPMKMGEIRELLEDVKVIILDEISMVSPRLLYRLHETLQKAMNNFTEPFGGLAILALGRYW